MDLTYSSHLESSESIKIKIKSNLLSKGVDRAKFMSKLSELSNFPFGLVAANTVQREFNLHTIPIITS